MPLHLLPLVGALALLWCAPALAATPEPTPEATPTPTPTPAASDEPWPTESPLPTDDVDDEVVDAELTETSILVVGRGGSDAETAGSGHRIGRKELEKHEEDDPHRILRRIPGVYLREEDGFGLRPNIGMRGAASDRSSKVTLMEDGVLFGPAPYSAPAAYYFPLMTRMTAVEVYKGPASIEYGPNTIGGAVNMQTRRIPHRPKGELDVAFGSERTGKAHGHFGLGGEHWGVLVEGVHLRSDGFKDIDGTNDESGFEKNELMLKAKLNTDASQKVYHRLDLKVGYSDELSLETYLGLTDADFNSRPLRRYAASQLGRMRWDRSQAQLRYTLTAGENLDVTLTGYRFDFQRAWRKLNRFAGFAPDLHRILQSPNAGANGVFLDILRGDADSTTDDETLLIGTNDRTYVSQGIQAGAKWRFMLGPIHQELRFGFRFHNDSIERDHTEDSFQMRSGTLVRDFTPTQTTVRNRGSANAVALHLLDRISWGPLTVAPGVRFEHIETKLKNRIADTTNEDTMNVVVPGVALLYQPLSWLWLFGGVHQGFSPRSPGPNTDGDVEKSVNYELGSRAAIEDPLPLFGGISLASTRAELTGFFNDYSNITGQCTFSQDCRDDQIGDQFDGGEARVVGAEASLSQQLGLPWGLMFSYRLTYTFTDATFQNSFDSNFPVWGTVESGDELPYVPRHLMSFTTGFAGESWSIDFTVSHNGEMRDVAGQGRIPDADRIPDYTVLDVVASWSPIKHSRFYLKADNILDDPYIVSKRPFGARPGKPFLLLVGYKQGLRF